MNIFEYLKNDDEYIERKLKNFAAHASEWSLEQIFIESAQLIKSITAHIDKKEALLTEYLYSPDEELSETLKQAGKLREEIKEQIESLTQTHIDESDFGKTMLALLKEMTEHRKFCCEQLYPRIETHLSKTERALIEEKLEDMVFS